MGELYDESIMKKYTRLVLSDREEISRGLAEGKSFKEIALTIGKDKSTVSRELKRVGVDKNNYRAIQAQLTANLTSYHPKKKSKVLSNPKLKSFIHGQLKQYWSPEQIAAELKILYPHDKTMRVSHETIYQYIFVLARGRLREELKSYLRHRNRPGQARGQNHRKSSVIKDFISIKERPEEVANRTVPGHWEGDLIIGKDRASALGTLVERMTRATILIPLKGKDAPSVRKAFSKELKSLPKQMKLSLTYDRGSEMSEHQLLARNVKMKVYFADPYSPWQRGTNENTNGLIRQFFPKGTDFKTVSRRRIKIVQDLLNGRPRKVLDYQKPYEVFNQLLR